MARIKSRADDMEGVVANEFYMNVRCTPRPLCRIL